MTAKVSTEGLDFIASWSPFSTTVYKVEVDTVVGDVEYVGYSYYGSALPFRSPDTPLPSTLTEDEASDILFKELKSAMFQLVDDFGFDYFTQTEFDALISLLTTYRDYDYYNSFKQTSLYSALKADKTSENINSLITSFEWNEDVVASPKSFNVFYNLTERRTAEANLYTSGTYNNCSNLAISEKTVDGVKVFY